MQWSHRGGGGGSVHLGLLSVLYKEDEGAGEGKESQRNKKKTTHPEIKACLRAWLRQLMMPRARAPIKTTEHRVDIWGVSGKRVT